jgi:hypothetical protein
MCHILGILLYWMACMLRQLDPSRRQAEQLTNIDFAMWLIKERRSIMPKDMTGERVR